RASTSASAGSASARSDGRGFVIPDLIREPAQMIVSEAPGIETDRLVLRPWRKDDFRPYHAILSHPEVHRHFGPTPMSAEEAWRRLTSFVGGWQFLGFRMWAVEEKASGKLVGVVGLFNAWRDLEPQFGDEPEMGWIMAAETHGKGLGSASWCWATEVAQ